MKISLLSLLFILTLLVGCKKDEEVSGLENLKKAKTTKASTIANDQYIPLVVVLYEHDFSGRSRVFINDCSDLVITGAFNDRTSSISIHKGPNYQDFKNTYGKEPTVSFYQNGYSGVAITLEVGRYSYSKLSSLNMNDQISSLKFFADISTTIPPSYPETNYVFQNIYLVTRIWQNNYSGWQMTILCTGDSLINKISSFGAVFDGGVDNNTSSLSVAKGPSWVPNCAIRFWVNPGYSGAYKQYQSGVAESLVPPATPFNDTYSSCQSFYW